ncbi:MAG TPA: hypothetical protein PLL64_11450, partial [Rhodothermales bacterium]|nr:hypothetical protein [Rhodothermales bacterium]
MPTTLYSQTTTYSYTPSDDVCKGNVIFMRARNLNNTAQTIGFRVYKATTATSCTNTSFAGSGTIQIREGNRTTGAIVASQSYSVGASWVDLTVKLNFTSGTKTYYAKVVDANNDYWDGPVSITATTVNPPILTSPSNATVFSNVPPSIAFQWNKNNPSGTTTYVLKVREEVNGVASTIIYESNVGDASNRTLSQSDYTNGGIQAGKTYRWVVYPANRDELAAQYFTFSVNAATTINLPILTSPSNATVFSNVPPS